MEHYHCIPMKLPAIEISFFAGTMGVFISIIFQLKNLG